MQRNANRHWAMATALAGVSLAAIAAEPVTPGDIGSTLKRPTPLQAPAPAPSIASPGRKPARGAAETGPRITVHRFEFSGNTVFPSETLQKLVAGYVGKPITLNDIYEAADKLSDYYARHGYTLANVSVPAQSVKNGVIRLEVVEGRIGKVEFDGNKYYSSERLHYFMSRTKPGQVYRGDDLQHDLLELNSLPGLATRAVLKPGSDFGTTDVVVKTHDQKIDGVFTADNYGRQDVGEYRYSAQIGVNDLLDFADRFQLTALHSNTNRLNYGDVAYSFPLTANGLSFSADYGYAYFDVAPPLPSTGKNKNANIGFTQTWVRSYRDTFATSLGYLYTNANATLDGLVLPTNTNISLLNIGANESHSWSNGALTQFNGSIHTNFASEHQASKNDPADLNREEFRAEIDVQHMEPLFLGMQALANVDGVYSPNQLADTEKIAIGGPTSIRGFPPSEERGDRGYFGQFTLRRPFVIGPVVLTPRAVGDSGIVFDLDEPKGAKRSDSLSSAGAGLDVAYRTFTLRIDWSEPLDSKPVSDDKDDGRVYGSLSASF